MVRLHYDLGTGSSPPQRARRVESEPLFLQGNVLQVDDAGPVVGDDERFLVSDLQLCKGSDLPGALPIGVDGEEDPGEVEPRLRFEVRNVASDPNNSASSRVDRSRNVS